MDIFLCLIFQNFPEFPFHKGPFFRRHFGQHIYKAVFEALILNHSGKKSPISCSWDFVINISPSPVRSQFSFTSNSLQIDLIV